MRCQRKGCIFIEIVLEVTSTVFLLIWPVKLFKIFFRVLKIEFIVYDNGLNEILYVQEGMWQLVSKMQVKQHFPAN